MNSSKDKQSPDYTPIAGLYVQSRPQYPGELFAYIASLTVKRKLAWDCATGNGQAALGLAARDYVQDRLVGAGPAACDQALANGANPKAGVPVP